MTKDTNDGSEVIALAILLIVVFWMIVGILGTVYSYYLVNLVLHVIFWLSIGLAVITVLILAASYVHARNEPGWDLTRAPAACLIVLAGIGLGIWLVYAPLSNDQEISQAYWLFAEVRPGADNWVSDALSIALEHPSPSKFLARQAFGIAPMLLAVIWVATLDIIAARNLLDTHPVHLPSWLLWLGPGLIAVSILLLGFPRIS